MKKAIPAASPDAYVGALDGWRRRCVTALRQSVRAAADLEEVLKWGHLVYLANGPVLLIRAEPERVLFGFWRGQRLGSIEPRLKAGGKYEMATLELREGMDIKPATVRHLIREAVALNRSAGDPTLAAARPSKAGMASTDLKFVDEYIETQPEGARKILRTVRSTIRGAVPQAQEMISYRIPAYKLHGQVVDYFAGWKHHYAVYPATGQLRSKFKDELAPYDVTKGTIRFPFSQPVPVKLIGRIARFRAREAVGLARTKLARTRRRV